MRCHMILATFVLVCGLCALTAQAQTMQPPKPGPEVKKMAVFVGHFTNDGEAKAGVMGPNSPAMKMSGTEDCKWTSGGFAVLCTGTSEMGGMKTTETALMYYDAGDKMYHYTSSDSAGDAGQSTATVDGDTWTWSGKGFMGGHPMYSKFTMKGVSRNGFDWTMAAGDSESSMQEGMTGKEMRVTMPAKSADSKPSAQ